MYFNAFKFRKRQILRLESGAGSSILAQSGAKKLKAEQRKHRTFYKFCKIAFKVKKSEKAVLTKQKLEPYGAASSHIIEWSQSRSR
jgi:hypothetical protein